MEISIGRRCIVLNKNKDNTIENEDILIESNNNILESNRIKKILWRCEKCTHKWTTDNLTKQNNCPECLSGDIAHF